MSCHVVTGNGLRQITSAKPEPKGEQTVTRNISSDSQVQCQRPVPALSLQTTLRHKQNNALCASDRQTVDSPVDKPIAHGLRGH